ncbi:MAG: asparagine synthase (glutamine-hydrolyzing) [Bacteroidales bacterium]|nr:asparagine synthase (glutamine-hydrolyzing) [Bacteroidales bacterium]
MCGIAGIVDLRNALTDKSLIKSMLGAISFRGPDESGIYYSPNACLGHVRLSILDLSTGQQPLSDSQGRFWIVYNGEIFNYPDLRDMLLKKGVVFKTNSDTEVLVNLYAIYGRDCLPMLNGQFAFAIWDNHEKELFIARDRVGIRPLYYNTENGIFTFASEIKSIFVQDKIAPELSSENLAQIFTFWTALSPNTAFRNIFELSPGHCLTYSKKGLRVFKYWELQYGDPDQSLTLEKALIQFSELFHDAVRIRLRADVEVAAYLSGGIDSSSTVAYIKDIEPDTLNTFSIGFADKEFDETAYQNEAARYLNTRHRSITCTAGDIAGCFPRVIWHTETPLTRTAPVPMYLLSKFVRENSIKVVITGEGADEMLAGYDIFKEALIRRFWAQQPDSAIRPRLLTKLYPFLPQMKEANPAILKMFFGYKLEDTENPFYSHLLRWNNANHILKHFSDRIKSELNGYSAISDLENKLPSDFNRMSQLAKAQWLETSIFMSGYLLSSQGDRMAAANSVEGRYPFLDYRVIEFCNKLPGDFKLRGLNEKYLLKKLMKNRIPESIINRSKQPYRAPIKNVFFLNNPPELIKEMLSPSYFHKIGIFNHDSVAKLMLKIEKTNTASEIEDMILASVVSTHLLHYQFVEKHSENIQNGGIKNPKIVEDFKSI